MRYVTLFLLLASATALAHSPLQDAKDAAQRGDYAQALTLLQPLAEQGNAKAQYNLALFHLQGIGVAKNRATAQTLLEKAAAQNLPEAQLALGKMLLYGEDGMTTYDAPAMQSQSKPDQTQREHGIALITQAAEQGLASAQETLGHLWLNGWRTTEPRGDAQQAAHWLSKAAEQDNADAQYTFALLYRDGNGVAQDCDKALQWFEKAGNNGDWAAYGEISRLYARGECVAKDARKAAEWENKAKQALENQAKPSP